MHLGIIELILVTALVLGIGFWQLWSVNQAIRKDRGKKPDRPPDG